MGTAIQRTYTEREILEGLTEIAACNGRPTLASRRLAERGLTIPKETLCSWKNEVHRDRYEQLAPQVRDRIHHLLADESEELALREGELSRTLTDKLRKALEADTDARDLNYLASTLRNTETSRGIAIDKSTLLRGRPSTVIEHRSTPAETVRSLARLAPSLIYEGTAEEIPEAEQDTDPVALPATGTDPHDQRSRTS